MVIHFSAYDELLRIILKAAMVNMHIVHIAAELTPIAKVGGLADVVLGLGRELQWKGHQVEIILPKYDCLDLRDVCDLEIVVHDLWSYFRGHWYHNTIWRGHVEGLTVYFIESHDPHHYFNRNVVYGCHDDIDRFTYFSRAALEFLLKHQSKPDILHIHDWPTAIIAPLYADIYRGLGLNSAKLVFTIHNLEYQGLCHPRNLEDVGLHGQNYLTPELLQDNLCPQDLNLLKGGIVFSDFITTVSPTYAQEAFTKVGGKSLETTLRIHQNKFSGILNGVDYTYWNPELDRLLPFHYGFKDISKRKKQHPFIANKNKIKEHLKHVLSLVDNNKPIVSCITRLVSQKGPELIKHAIFHTLEKNGQFILLASSADQSTQEEFLNLKTHLADNRNVHIELSFNEQLSHLVYAGSDFIIVPSIFEPCGLTQMIGMKYGTVPIVRQTGGLADTVWDVDFAEQAKEKRNGYSFVTPTAKSLDEALDRALKCWHEQPEQWRKIMENGMGMDFSWNKPSDQYLEIYQSLHST